MRASSLRLCSAVCLIFLILLGPVLAEARSKPHDGKLKDSKKIEGTLAEKIQGAEPEDELPVIIFYRRDANKSNLKSAQSAIAKSEGKIKRTYSLIDALSAKVKAGKIKNLAGDQSIERIYYDFELSILPWELSNTTPKLSTSTQAIGANYVWDTLGYTGTGIKVAVVDTGIDYNHSDLGDGFGKRVIGGYDFVNDDSDPMDDNDHGTHVAGIIGANGSIRGVAPNVSFYALKVCNSGGGCSTSDIISGIDWAVANGAHVISMSLGGRIWPFESKSPNDEFASPTAIAADAAVDRGVVVVVAAGNEGPGTGTVSQPGIAKKVITVGASDDKNTASVSNDTIASFSNRGPSAFGRLDPELVAPGVGINSTVRNNGYRSFDGTSMATPHVSGAAALLLQRDPTLTPLEVRAILMQTSSGITNGRNHTFDQGAGIINVTKAMTYVIKVRINGNDRWDETVIPGFNTSADLTIYNNASFPINFTFSLSTISDLEGDNTLSAEYFGIPKYVVVQSNSNNSIKLNFSVPTNVKPAIYGATLSVIGNNSETLRIPVVITVPLLEEGKIQGTLNDELVCPCITQLGDLVYYSVRSHNGTAMTATLNWTDGSDDIDLYLFSPNGALVDLSVAPTGTSELVKTANMVYDEYWLAVHAYTLIGNGSYNLTVKYESGLKVTPSQFQGLIKKGKEQKIIFEVKNDNKPKTDLNVSVNRLTGGQSDFFNATLGNTGSNYNVTWNASSRGINTTFVRYANVTLQWSDYNKDLDLLLVCLNGTTWTSTRFESRHNSSVLRSAREELSNIDIQYYLKTYQDFGFAIKNPSSTEAYNLTVNFTEVSPWDSASLNETSVDFNASAIKSIDVRINTSQLDVNQTYDAFFRIWNTSEDFATVSIRLSILEDTPPLIKVVSPENRTYFTEVIDFNITVDEPLTRDGAWYSLDGGQNNSMTNDSLFNWYNVSHPPLSPCTLNVCPHTITFYANDTTSNISEELVWFTVVYPVTNLASGLNYTSIQAAINNASEGDILEASLSVTFAENVKVNKSVNLRAANTTVMATNFSDNIFEITANGVNISGFAIAGTNLAGVFINGANYSNISNNNVSGNGLGIYLYYSINSTIANNNVSRNSKGILVNSTSYNVVASNNATNNSEAGIFLLNSHNNTLIDNFLNINKNYGIQLNSSANNTIANNTATSNANGIAISNSSNNSIYHNNFINNTNQANDSGQNNWDNGYPSGGNYWSDYDSDAEGCFDSNNDFVCDYPYNIAGGSNRDRYPVNQTNGWLLIVQDTTGPTITFVPPTPANNSITNKSWVLVNVTLGENGNATLEWDSINYTMEGAYSNWFLNKTLGDGNHPVRVYANDTVGNSNASERRNITVDNTPPSVSNLTITPSLPEVSALVNITVNVTDVTSGVHMVVANVTYPNGTSLALLMQPGSIYRFDGFNASVFGKYNVSIYANDSAENVNSTFRASFSSVFTAANTSNVTNGTTANVLGISSVLDLFATANESLNATISLTALISKTADILGADEINSSNSGGLEKPLRYLNASNLTVIENITKITLRIYYTSSEISDLNLNEDSLAILFWNGSRWLKVSDYKGNTIPNGPKVIDAGINKDGKYVFADLDRLSVYGIAGNIKVEQPPPKQVSSGGGGGGGGGVSAIVEGLQELTASLFTNVLKELGLISKQFYSLVSNSLASVLAITGDYTGEYPAPSAESYRTALSKPVKPLEGDVYELAAKQVRKKWAFVNTIVITRGDLEVDSLAAVAYAKARGFPILLTKPGELPDVTLKTVKELGPTKVIIVGGTVAVSSVVEGELKNIAATERIWGNTRVETAVELAKNLEKTETIKTIIVTDGRKANTDAALLAAAYRAPVIYTAGTALPQVTRDFLASHKMMEGAKTKVVLLGVSSEAKQEIEAAMK